MVRITDPPKSRAFYEALGFSFAREMDIVRNGEKEATNYFFSLPGSDNVLELTFNHDGRTLRQRHRLRPYRDRRRGSGRHPPAAGRPGHRARAAALHGQRRRVAAVLRPRPRRLPDRADRTARLVADGGYRREPVAAARLPPVWPPLPRVRPALPRCSPARTGLRARPPRAASPGRPRARARTPPGRLRRRGRSSPRPTAARGRARPRWLREGDRRARPAPHPRLGGRAGRAAG